MQWLRLARVYLWKGHRPMVISALIGLAALVYACMLFQPPKEAGDQEDAPVGVEKEIADYTAKHWEMQKFHVTADYTSPDAYIAGCGACVGEAAPGSPEALQELLQQGFKFFQADLQETSDGHLAAGHGGVNWAEAMAANPEMVLIIGKIRNYGLLLQELPYPDRLIVVADNAEDYVRALRAGVKYPAMRMDSPALLDNVERLRLPIIVLDAKRFFGTTEGILAVQRLHQRKVTVLLYDSEGAYDTPDFLRQHLGKTISKFFTTHPMPSAQP